MTGPTAADPTIKDQAGVLLGSVAGYVAHRTVAMGLRQGLVAALADGPASADELAERTGADPFYTGVWCRSALAAGVVDRRDGDRFELAPHVATLLLDDEHPAYVGGVFVVLSQPEVFDRFEAELQRGTRLWWDECSNEFIRGVAGTGRPFSRRLIPDGLAQVPGLVERLEGGATIVETCSGAGYGLRRLATSFPDCRIIGVDGDTYSLELAAEQLAAAGLSDRVELVHSSMEDLDITPDAAVVINNISMHECRDIDAATRNMHAALEPGGWFVISDFPFPDTDDGLRTVPGRVMSGIQFFEAQIDDQLLPRSAYDVLLARHGFQDIGAFELTPVHAVTYGRR